MTEKKPDLSDLKARLGLTKPGAAPPGMAPPPGAVPPPGAAAPAPEVTPANPSVTPAPVPTAAPAPAAAPTAVAAPAAAPQAAAPQAAAPQPAAPQAFAPPAASGPPAAAFAPPSAAPPRAQAPAPKPKAERVAPAASSISAEIDIAGMDSAPAFPKTVVIIFGILFVLGLVFGWGIANSMFQNEINTARTADAQTLKDSYSPKIAAFNEILPKIMAMSDTTVDFAGAEALTKAEFAAGGNQLANNRLLIGSVAIDNITSYAADTQLLAAMIQEHHRLTNSVDKEELEQLQAENKILENDFFGVVFDYKHALKNGGDENYVPKEGTLVISRGPAEGEVGKVKVEYPGNGSEAVVEIAGFVPIGKNQIMKSGGQTALTRYQWRVRQLKFQADKVSKYTESLINSLDVVIGGGEPEAAKPAAKAAE